MISETDTKRFFGSIFGLLNSVGVPNEGGKCIKKQMFKFLSDTVLQDWAWRRGVIFGKALLSPKIVLWVESRDRV
jgi:hypothetical protein